jgi:hypothetical protein
MKRGLGPNAQVKSPVFDRMREVIFMVGEGRQSVRIQS